MALLHLEAHLATVVQQLTTIATRAVKAKEAVKAISSEDLTSAILGRPGGTHNLLNQIQNSFLSGYLETLTKLLTDRDTKRLVADKQQAIELERIIKLAFPNFSLTQFESLLHKVMNDRERAAEVKRASTPAGSSGGASSSGVFAFRIVNKNGKPTIDILNDSGAGASSWYKPDDPDWLKIQNSLNGIKGH